MDAERMDARCDMDVESDYDTAMSDAEPADAKRT